MTPKTLLLTIVALIVTGCGGGGDNGTSAPIIVGPDPTTLSVAAQTADGLSVTLAQDKSTLPVNGTITYTMTIANGTAQAVSVPSPGTFGGQIVPSVSLSIVDAGGASVFPANYPGTVPTPTPPGQSVSLTPGGFLSETLTLPGVFTKAGRYSAAATFTTSGGTTTTAGPLVATAR